MRHLAQRCKTGGAELLFFSLLLTEKKELKINCRKYSVNEKSIEQRLAQMVKKAGGMAPKFVSPSFAGMPDRLILLPDGKMAFAELKAPGMKPRTLQVARHEMLRRLGFKVYVIDGTEQIGEMLNELQTP